MREPHELITAYLNDTLTEAEQAELATWLKANPENLKAFVEANLFEQEIRRAVRGQVQREAADTFIEPEKPSNWQLWLRSFWPKWETFGATAISVALIGVIIWLNRPEVVSSLAQVTRTHSVQVPAQMEAFKIGQRLGPGRLTLVAGVMEITLRNGATLVFEGPGELELLSEMRALLHSGQAVVRVTERAKGFRLETAGAQVVDLSTEFGVKCGPGGVTDVQVFDGKVVASAAGASTGFPHELTAGKATRFIPDQPAPTDIAYRPERFVRRLPADKPIELDGKGSPLFNATRIEQVVIPRLDKSLTIDGDLLDWNGAESFRVARENSSGEFVEGRLCYDNEYLYVGAHIGDPAPMRNVVDPATDGELGWRGGGLQIRLSTDPTMGWPVDANGPVYYQFRRLPPDTAQLTRATSDRLAHLTLWYFAPAAQPCLHIAFGMDLHGGVVNPKGFQGAFHKDPDGRGYTLEYAIPWKVLKAANVPQPGDTLAMSWTAHWSDQGGRLWRGQLVELRNASEPVRIHTWERAATWGRAVYR